MVALILFGPKGLAQVICYSLSAAMLPCRCATGQLLFWPKILTGLHILVDMERFDGGHTDVLRIVLVQAVKSLGATFRTVQPTIRELVSASNELRTSLEEQIGLDEIRNEFRTPASSSRPSAPYNPELPSSSNGAAAPSGSSQGAGDSSEHSASNVDRSGDYFGTEFDVDIEAKRREAAQLAWGTATGSDKPVPKDTGSSQHDGTDKPLAALSLAELEAELARRKAAKADSNKGSD